MYFVRRWGLPVLVVCLPALAAAYAAASAPDEGPAPAEGKALDALVHKTLREVINEGADMYNAQGKYLNAERDFSGCYRLYEGALMATKPLLDNHPDLQKAIDDGLAAAAATPQPERRAFVLRAVIDKVRDAVNPNPVAVKPPTPPTPPTPPGPAKETTATGKAVSAGGSKLTLNVSGEDRHFTVPETAKVTIDDKDGTLDDVKKDSTVTVVSKGDVVTKVDVKSPAAPPPPPPPPPPAKETKSAGKVTKVEKDKLTLKDDEGKEKSFTVPETAKVTIDGKDGLLDDVKNDSAVTVTSKGDEVTKVEVKGLAAPPPPPPPEAKTLWDRLGGEANVAKVVDDFVNTAGKDPKVNFWRDPTKVPSKEEVADLKKHLVAFVSSVTGGPLKYEGKSMKEAHKGMKITSEEFDAAANDLKEVLEKDGAKADDLKAVMALVDSTRKDIVEDKKPDDTPKPPADKDKPAATDKDKPAPPAEKDKAAPPPLLPPPPPPRGER